MTLNSGTVARHLAAGHPAADGHFPGNPIIPGAVLLREAVAAIAATVNAAAGGAVAGFEIRAAKFHHPVRPGETLVISWTAAGEDIRFSCAIAGADRPAMTGVLRLPSP